MSNDSIDATADQALPAGSMFSLGWLMAELFGSFQQRLGSDTSAHLPALSELDAGSYVEITFLELEKLLALWPGLSDADVKATWAAADHEGFTAAVQALHLKILHQLVGDHRQLSAYQLGRALSDTCWPPDEKASPDFVLHEFSRTRLATLQAWLTEAGSALPAQSAATVSRSLQNWQDWADINAAGLKAGWATAHAQVVGALHTQASAWHALLAGETDLSGQTSVDAWVQAAQSMLRTSRLLMRTIIRRFWGGCAGHRRGHRRPAVPRGGEQQRDDPGVDQPGHRGGCARRHRRRPAGGGLEGRRRNRAEYPGCGDPGRPGLEYHLAPDPAAEPPGEVPAGQSRGSRAAGQARARAA